MMKNANSIVEVESKQERYNKRERERERGGGGGGGVARGRWIEKMNINKTIMKN